MISFLLSFDPIQEPINLILGGILSGKKKGGKQKMFIESIRALRVEEFSTEILTLSDQFTLVHPDITPPLVFL